MAHIMFLSPADFTIVGQKVKTLGISKMGNVLVLFKMSNDANCNQFEPIFATLATQENRVGFAVVDISPTSPGREVVIWSRNTTTPINGVPMLLLYVNGVPHAKFNGARTVQSIRTFITKALEAAMSRGSPTVAPPASQGQFMQTPTAASYTPMPTGAGGNMYGGPAPRGGPHYAPEIKSPSLKGVIKGGVPQGGVEVEEEYKLEIPDDVVPHNTPWEADPALQ